MATQMQLQVILTGSRIATRVLWSRDNQKVDEDVKRKAEIVSVSVFSKVLSLD